tara:strand:- start:477 stop:743 length:267 start_codon:yes stop_codon:yes gene_type:complete
MDKKFLDKVIEQIIYETEVSNGKVYFPFFGFGGIPRKSISPSRITSLLLHNFGDHCRDVYGLSYGDEIITAWGKFKNEYFDKFPYNGF